ncbi:hypothetical protein [Paraburkholderia sp.]|nr:hypothetical protein [Paraburkholderia sp.]
MIAISGPSTLLTNLVIAWDTHRPAHFAHVNFGGTLSFPLDR